MSHRLASALALSILALPALAAACGGKVVLDGAGGAGTSTSASSGAAGGLPACSMMFSDCNTLVAMVCFTPNPGQACPDAAGAKPFLDDGCDVMSVEAACSGGPAGECCYNATEECCG